MTSIQSVVYVTFNVAPSLKFRREGDDIHCDVEISIAQAVLGGTVKVPGIVQDTFVQVCSIPLKGAFLAFLDPS